MQAVWQQCKVCIHALIAVLLGQSHGCDQQKAARTLTDNLHLQALAALMDTGRTLQDLDRLDAHVLCSALFRARDHLTPSELVELSFLLHLVPGTLPLQCSAGRQGLLVHIVSQYVLTGAAGAFDTCTLCLLTALNALHLMFGAVHEIHWLCLSDCDSAECYTCNQVPPRSATRTNCVVAVPSSLLHAAIAMGTRTCCRAR